MADSDVNPVDGEGARPDPAAPDREELFDLLSENTTDFIRLHDPTGRTVYSSPSVERLYGRAPTTLFEFAHPDDLAACRAWWDHVLAGGRDRLHWRARDAGGNWRWLETSAALVRYRGRPHVLTVCRDVTERTEAEEALHRSEEQLRLAIDAIPVMAWTVRPDGVVDYLNRRWTDYSGLSLEQYAADPLAPMHPEDVARIYDNWRVRMAAGETYDDEMRLRRSDGEYRWFLVRTAPVHDEQGRVVKWYGVSTDIEDRKRAEAAMRQSERMLNEAQRIAHIGHWEWDTETDRLTLSDEMYRIVGLAPQEGVRTLAEWREYVHPED